MPNVTSDIIKVTP